MDSKDSWPVDNPYYSAQPAFMGLAEARCRLERIVRDAFERKAMREIVVGGRTLAAIVNVEDLECLALAGAPDIGRYKESAKPLASYPDVNAKLLSACQDAFYRASATVIGQEGEARAVVVHPRDAAFIRALHASRVPA